MDRVPALSARPTIAGLTSFGVAEALREGYAALDFIAHGLRSGAGGNRPQITAPFHFDSRRLCMLLYKAGLADVQWRFWTTTYLSSGFWSEENSDILQWNREALHRLHHAGAAARRLFLLPLPPEAEIRRWYDQRVLMRKYDDAAGLANLDGRLVSLCSSVERLSALGCEVRTVHDAAARHKRLPAEISIDGVDSELAIYDDWRFDLFQGGQSGAVQSVKVYTPAMEGFERHLLRIVDYFESLWREADPMSDLLAQIKEASEQSAKRIDYHPIWLARYDHALPKDDDRLKRSEFQGVERELRWHGSWGALRRVLDVGTCTARYPIALRDAVAEDGQIFGVDNDRDAVRFARRNVADACGGDQRIRIEHLDFCAGQFSLAGPFDLITCMLGTLLHFNCDGAQPPYADGLQLALERFASLLADDGVLFFSVWTQRARRSRRVLSIYSEDDKRQLATWKVTSRQLRERLRTANLTVLARTRIEDRMDLYCCARADGAGNSKHHPDGGDRHGKAGQEQGRISIASKGRGRSQRDDARSRRH